MITNAERGSFVSLVRLAAKSRLKGAMHMAREYDRRIERFYAKYKKHEDALFEIETNVRINLENALDREV